MITIRMIIIAFAVQLTVNSCAAQVTGCTDPLANNYDPSATVNDGSCTYDPYAVSPKKTFQLGDQVKETSGLLIWDGYLWTHNDNSDLNLYGLDTTNGDIKRKYTIEDVENTDWEEITQDIDYIYIGDFGNNGNGNRTDLHILRVGKNSLKVGAPLIDTIWFTYSDQTDFSPKGLNQTDFDCEAFIVTMDSIYLFTKQWVSLETSLYGLPKIPGTHSARKISTYDVGGMVTGATYLENSRVIALCGYTSLLHPFLHLLYDFNGHDFFGGNNRRVTVSLPLHQVEGISSVDGLTYYITNESHIVPLVSNNPQKLHILDLGSLLESFVSGLSPYETHDEKSVFRVFPNPVQNIAFLTVDESLVGVSYKIVDTSGETVYQGVGTAEDSAIELHYLPSGVYYLLAENLPGRSIKIVKL